MRLKRLAIQLGKEAKRYAAVAERASSARWARLSTPSLSASGRRLRRATMGRDAGGQVGSELVEVADDGGKRDDEKEDDGEKDGAEQKQDGERARDGMGAAKTEAHDAVDDAA